MLEFSAIVFLLWLSCAVVKICKRFQLRKGFKTFFAVQVVGLLERGIVDLETLQKTNADLIQTLDDVMRIQMEGRQKRQAAEMEMHRMEEELKRKLLEIR